MTIDYTFEMHDWMEFNKHHLNHSKQFKRTKMIMIAVVPVVLTVMTIINAIKGKFSFVGLTVGVIFSMLWLLFYPKRMDKMALKNARKTIESGDNSGLLGKQQLKLNENGFTHITPVSENHLKWEAIKKIESSDTHYFLYNTAVSAIVLPIGNDAEKCKEFIEIVKSHMV